VRYLFQRVVHNENGWISPSSGRLKSSNDGGYLEKNGFGHEDWNFSNDPCADGYVYGYTYYVPKDDTGSFNILFAHYDRGEGWALGGYYEKARFIAGGVKLPIAVLRKRARELKVLDAENSLGGKFRGASIDRLTKLLQSGDDIYCWRVSLSNIHRMQQPLRLPRSLTARFGAHFSRPTELMKSEWEKIVEFSADFTDKEPSDDYIDGGDTEFPEGAEYEIKHKQRERSRALVTQAKAQFIRTHGHLFCEACGFDFRKTYGKVGDGFIEAHHLTPVSELKSGAKTKISDLALVCSNCHRMLHRKRPWLSISALRQLLK
jgi:hypothetical protein